MLWLRILVFLVAIVYLWVYPSMLLVPVEYRAGFWSFDYNVPQKGIVIGREVYDIEGFFNNHSVYKVEILSNGELQQYWVANETVGSHLIEQEIVKFETRGNVIVLAELVKHPTTSVSRIN